MLPYLDNASLESLIERTTGRKTSLQYGALTTLVDICSRQSAGPLGGGEEELLRGSAEVQQHMNSNRDELLDVALTLIRVGAPEFEHGRRYAKDYVALRSPIFVQNAINLLGALVSYPAPTRVVQALCNIVATPQSFYHYAALMQLRTIGTREALPTLKAKAGNLRIKAFFSKEARESLEWMQSIIEEIESRESRQQGKA